MCPGSPVPCTLVLLTLWPTSAGTVKMLSGAAVSGSFMLGVHPEALPVTSVTLHTTSKLVLVRSDLPQRETLRNDRIWPRQRRVMMGQQEAGGWHGFEPRPLQTQSPTSFHRTKISAPLLLAELAPLLAIK